MCLSRKLFVFFFVSKNVIDGLLYVNEDSSLVVFNVDEESSKVVLMSRKKVLGFFFLFQRGREIFVPFVINVFFCIRSTIS